MLQPNDTALSHCTLPYGLPLNLSPFSRANVWFFSSGLLQKRGSVVWRTRSHSLCRYERMWHRNILYFLFLWFLVLCLMLVSLFPNDHSIPWTLNSLSYAIVWSRFMFSNTLAKTNFQAMHFCSIPAGLHLTVFGVICNYKHATHLDMHRIGEGIH